MTKQETNVSHGNGSGEATLGSTAADGLVGRETPPRYLRRQHMALYHLLDEPTPSHGPQGQLWLTVCGEHIPVAGDIVAVNEITPPAEACRACLTRAGQVGDTRTPLAALSADEWQARLRKEAASAALTKAALDYAEAVRDHGAIARRLAREQAAGFGAGQ